MFISVLPFYCKNLLPNKQMYWKPMLPHLILEINVTKCFCYYLCNMAAFGIIFVLVFKYGNGKQ